MISTPAITRTSKRRSAALHEARGAFIHLLNNDTEVTADWLDTMLDLFAARPDCGLV